MVRVKHIPRRTCVACHEATAKRTLIRLVRTPEGRVVIDPTGKQAGRGAYLCAAAECWARALTRGHLARALRVTLKPDDQAALSEYGRGLPGADEATTSPIAARAD